MAAPAPEPARDSRFNPVLFEVLAIFAALYLPSAVLGLYDRTPSWAFFDLRWGRLFYDIVRDGGKILLVSFIIWNSGDGFRAFGFKKANLLSDIPIATACFAISLVTGMIGLVVAGHSGTAWLADIGRHLQGTEFNISVAIWLLIALIATLASAAFEELLMRAYAIVRFKELFGNGVPAVVVAAILFSAWHFYQGLSGVIGTLLMGLSYGWIFAKTGRLWPLIAGHALFNFMLRLS